MDSFTLFSGLHLLTVGVCLLLIATVTGIGLQWRGTTQRDACCAEALAAATALYWLCLHHVAELGGWDLTGGLPLHICDINGIVAALALLTGNRWLRASSAISGPSRSPRRRSSSRT